MRLWHYKLIPALPNQMLVSQWRECIAIKRQWEKGTLKHRLVSYVMDYDEEYFANYTQRLVEEMRKRQIKFKEEYYAEILDFCLIDNCRTAEYEYKVYPEHNDRYLLQCFCNLQEKYDRGIISYDEWSKILMNESVYNILNLLKEE